MGSIPAVTLFSLPLLSYFEFVPRYTFRWLPWDAALFSYAGIVASEMRPWSYAVMSLQLFLFAGIALRWAIRVEARA